jgi:hypothetical protein
VINLVPVPDDAYNLSFDYTYASFMRSVIDTNGAGLTIYMSNDCDNTWSKIYNIKAWKLIQGISDMYYAPSEQNSWQKISIDLNKIAAAKTLKGPKVRFKFEMVGLVGANNFYLDNINIGKAEEDYRAGVEDVFINSELIHLFENPVVEDVLKFSIALNESDISYAIYDICGAVVADGNIKSTYNYINVEVLKSGNYILKVKTESSQDIVKFVKN